MNHALLWRSHRWLMLVPAAASLLLGACASPPSSDSRQAPVSQAVAQAPQAGTLFARLGGMQALEIVIDETLDHVASDARTASNFKDVNLEMLKQSMVSQLCQLSGGPCRYTGKTMAQAHAHRHVTAAQFDAFVELMADTLDKYASQPDKNALLAIIIPMKRDIIDVH